MEKTSIIVPIYRGGKYIDGMIAQIEDCAAKCDSVCALELLFVNDDPSEPVGNLASEMMETKVIETGVFTEPGCGDWSSVRGTMSFSWIRMTGSGRAIL